MSILKPKNVPVSSGVYFFRDKNRRVLYIGKAANLKNRIKSYFLGQKDPRPHTKRASMTKSSDLNNARYGVEARISKMLEAAETVDWQETDSEIESLILESQLIKKYRPPFNIMLRDDKQYFFVGFTKERFPKLIITHQPPKKFTVYSDQFTENKKLPVNQLKTERWSLSTNSIGPFTDGAALKTTLKLLRRIFPYCTCKQKHNNYCLNYHIGNCFGFCCIKKESTAKQAVAYKKNIAAIKEILSGKKKSLIKRFEKELNVIARKEKFEKAIELRDKIEKLKRVFENAQVLKKIGGKEIGGFNTLAELKEVLHLSAPPRRIEGYDVSNIQGEFATGAMAVFINGRPDKNEYRKFKIQRILPSEASRARPSQPKWLLRRRRQGGRGDTQMLAEIIRRRLNHPEWPYPDLILIDGGKGQLNTAVSVLKTLKLAIPIVALTKNINHIGDHILSTTIKTAVKIKKLPPVVRNLILQIDAEAHRFAIGYYRKLHRKKFKN